MGNETRITRVLKHPERIPRSLRWRYRTVRKKLRNAWVDFRTQKSTHATGSVALDEIKKKALVRTDVNDHLVTIFAESLSMSPRVIVELGVRGGESTFVMERVAALFSSKLVCVDIEDCDSSCAYEDSIFVKSDDIEFARRFESWCAENGIDPRIDVLMIDTSHLYEHTVQEIEHWFVFLADRAKVLFHDTNLCEVYRRRDGSLGMAWDNERGVIRALEDFFGTSFDEKEDFVDYRRGWLIKHHAVCSGLTILERIES